MTDEGRRATAAETMDAVLANHHSAPDPPDWDAIQDVLNAKWPLRHPDGRYHAIGIPDRPPIPAHVRVVFEHDGEVWLTGNATRWHGRCVFVLVYDKRLQVPGVWVDASDVRRVTPKK